MDRDGLLVTILVMLVALAVVLAWLAATAYSIQTDVRVVLNSTVGRAITSF